ncbi:MerR family transcriptional regulator [Streptomyces sp. NPDC059695]|uniref:MerR family transcriptional regulator n=1 Tax=Streptomyces sp. NPDC059695 TaxID=3346910 RepID=UPI003695EBDB
MPEATHGVTTGAVARRLGVSPTTVRSWEQRYGIGPAVRSSGRHRRWMPDDIALLEEMCRLTATGVPPGEAARVVLGQRPEALPDATGPLPVPEALPDAIVPVPVPEAEPPYQDGRQPGSGNGLPLGDVRQECRGLARAAVRLDSPSMEALLRQVVDDHGLVTAWEEVMVPTLHAVGRKWESSNDRYVEVEHLLSWQVSTALRRAAVARTPTAKGPPVVLACVPAESHTLPLEALAAGLAEQGLPFRMFGGAVPAEALDAAVRRSGPAVVVLWSQARSTASHALARHVAGLSFGLRGARTAPLVLLAGPGWAGPPPGDGLLRPGGLREALTVISSVYRDQGHGTGV